MGHARARKIPAQLVEDEEYQLRHERVAGIDIAKAKADVCTRLPPQRDGGRRASRVEDVPARAREILALAVRLAADGVELVVMESTSVIRRRQTGVCDGRRRPVLHVPRPVADGLSGDRLRPRQPTAEPVSLRPLVVAALSFPSQTHLRRHDLGNVQFPHIWTPDNRRIREVLPDGRPLGRATTHPRPTIQRLRRRDRPRGQAGDPQRC